MKKLFKKLTGMGKDEELVVEEEELDEEEFEEEEEEETAELEPVDHEETEEVAQEGEWNEDELEEGQLSIDVFQTPKAIVVKSTIAGVKPEDIDISINNDMLTIRGKRQQAHEIKEADYLFRECYWGSFSRSIILPVEIEADKIEAELENGVLSVTLPKARPAKQISIKVREK